jgi:hypothetical protein
MLLAWFEVVGVERAKQRFVLDASVEAIDQLEEERLAADALEQRRLLQWLGIWYEHLTFYADPSSRLSILHGSLRLQSMKYMLMLYEPDTDWDSVPRERLEAALAEHNAWLELLKERSIEHYGAALRPSNTATTLRP